MNRSSPWPKPPPAASPGLAVVAPAPTEAGRTARTPDLWSRLRTSDAACNFAWLAADRGLRLVLGLVVGSWIARHLGAGDFGTFSYALAFVGIFAALAPLGMEALVIREIIRDPREAGRWIGTVVGFRVTASVLLTLGSVPFLFALRPHDGPAWLVIGILSLGTILQSFDSAEVWFQARTQMRRLVVPRLAVTIAANLLKIVAVLQGGGLAWFALLSALEFSVSAGVTGWKVRRDLGPANPFRFEARRGWLLLGECWPLAVSALAIVLYMKLSQVVVGQMLGDAALGIYAAAIRVPEAALFLPMILSSSLLPGLVRSRALGREPYLAARLRFFRLNALISLAICVPLSFGAPLIIPALFGPGYQGAAPVMAVHAWSLPFVFLGVARAQHLLNERQTQLSLWYSVAGLGVNLVACFALIPSQGAIGAAYATVLAQFVSAFLSSFLHPSTREVGRDQCLALLTPWRVRTAVGPVPFPVPAASRVRP